MAIQLPQALLKDLKRLPFVGNNEYETYGGIVLTRMHEERGCVAQRMNGRGADGNGSDPPSTCRTMAMQAQRQSKHHLGGDGGTKDDEDDVTLMRVPIKKLMNYTDRTSVTFHVHPYVRHEHPRYIMFWGPSAADLELCCRLFVNRVWHAHVTVDARGVWIIEPTLKLAAATRRRDAQRTCGLVKAFVAKQLSDRYRSLARKERDDSEHPAYARLDVSTGTFDALRAQYGLSVRLVTDANGGRRRGK